MAHFAEIDENNVVLRVIVVADKDTSDENGVEVESIGVAFCNKLFGGNWLKTSYNNKIRKNYAGIGFTYDAQRDAFIPPKPYPSWVFEEEKCIYVAPVAKPSDGKPYYWDEESVSWKPVGE